MIETPPVPSSDPGRWIRAALMILPAGTVLLGIASFGIWQWKKDREADHSFKYAMALKREISLGGLEKHANLLRGVLRQADVMQAVPGYLQSTMGEENMGYNVRRDRFRAGEAECANIDAELSGKKMPYEVILVLVPYAANDEAGATALAVMLSMAHELTGQATLRTLRFAALPMVDGALEQMDARLKADGDRLMHLHVLGKMPEHLEAVWNTKAAGTVIDTPALPATAVDAVALANVLKTKLLREAGLP